MAENFYTILTNTGKAKLANAQALGTTVQFSSIAVGDGDGSYYDPVESQLTLKNEVWRGGINQIKTDDENPNWIIIEVVIPTTTGGFTVREAGIIDSEGDLIALGKYPATYKPALAEGSGKDLYIRMILEVSNASTIMLKIDPAIVLSTRGYVDDSIAEHNTDPLAHGNLPYLKTSQAADFAPSGYGIGERLNASIQDFNAATLGGLYDFGSTAVNGPPGINGGVCLIIPRNTNAGVTQLVFYGFYKGIYIRSSSNTQNTDWLEWREINAGTLGGKLPSDFWQVADAPFLFETTGYQKLPSGLILQWMAYNPGIVANDARFDMLFPISFPNLAFSVILSSTAGVTAGAQVSEGAEIESFTQSSCTVRSAWGYGISGPVRIFAIGY
jgi:hypothetical protein